MVNQLRRINSIAIGLAATIALLLLAATPFHAHAYELSGSKWTSGSQKIAITTSVTGTYKTQLKNAMANYTTFTDASMSATTSPVAWKSSVVTNNSADWEGITYSKSNASKRFTSAHCQLNTRFCRNYSAGKIKVVWLHELGHGWGLAHVKSSNHVMYRSASGAFDNGVKALTRDEINGINALY